MRIVFCSKSFYSGGHERMAWAINTHTPHEARALGPGVWIGRRRFGPGFERSGAVWDVNDQAQVDECLEWCDVLHAVYNCSLDSFGRGDLASKKLQVWHLATKWHPVFMTLFPRGLGDVHVALSAEGWERYLLPETDNISLLPVIFPLDEPLYAPCKFHRREQYASMSPRIRADKTLAGDPIAAPRSAGKVVDLLRGLPFRLVTGDEFTICMRKKRRAWVGIDDLVNPLVHLSGFEYLALGVPCFNRVDPILEASVKAVTGAEALPFMDADLATIREGAQWALAQPAAEWRERSREARAFMERYLHPREAVRRYVELYQGETIPIPSAAQVSGNIPISSLQS